MNLWRGEKVVNVRNAAAEDGNISSPDLKGEEVAGRNVAESEYFRQLIQRLAGISMGSAKHELVLSRLRPRLLALGGLSLAEYRAFLESLPRNHPEWQEFINRLTTNKTDFFREPQHFDYLVNSFLRDWLALRRKSDLRIWCAAASSGEEPFTLSMVLDRHLQAGRGYGILATDIDTQVLRIADNAVYPASRLSEIPQEFHSPCIDRGRGSVRDWFRIKPSVKSRVHFLQHNLMESALPQGEEEFDLVFCRNVLIYFQRSGVEFVTRKLLRAVRPGGMLFIGHSESLQGVKSGWRLVGPSIYRK